MPVRSSLRPLLDRVTPTAVLWRFRLALMIGLVGNNLVGAVVVYCLAALVVPLPDIADTRAVRIDNLVVTAILVPVAVLVGFGRGHGFVRGIARWLTEHREPTEREQIAVLRLPWRLFWMQFALWMLAALMFGLYNLTASIELGVLVATIVALAGLTTSSVSFLVAERVMRPLARRALATGVPQRVRVRSVASRTMLAWTMGSGVAVLGVVFVGLHSLAGPGDPTVHELSITMIVLGGIAFWAGGVTTFLAAKASSDPIRALRQGLAEVQHGRLEVSMPIYDGTEIGVLQAGFNDMVDGLREREQIRDLFGRHVGDDVAHAALAGGVRLGGEVRRVGVLFVDIIGSTTLATERPPDEVVGLLNRFFDVVIDVVHAYGGWINKFEGDAALAVWGAPVEVPDLEQVLLQAARVLGERLGHEVPDLRAGIGVSAGTAVAGNVGAAERYEYTVIGDPVNEAARLTELAKGVPSRVLARATLLDAASAESALWDRLDPVVVRGRDEPTPVATPHPAR